MNIKSNYKVGDNKEANKKNISDIVYATSEKINYVTILLKRNFI